MRSTRDTSGQALPPSSDRVPPGLWAILAVSVAILLGIAAWAYWPALQRIAVAWSSDPDYSHGFLVVPLAAWFLLRRREKRPPWSVTRGGVIGGSLLLLAAAGLRFLAARLYLPEIDAWSLPLWIGGVVCILAGPRMLGWAAPSIAFLWFATPLPGTLETWLSTPLQRFAAILSTAVLQMLGQPAIVEGTTILLEDHVLEVEQACSGMRMFYGVLALAVAVVILKQPGPGKSLFLILSTAPVAVAANVFRIVLTGLLQKYASSELAHRFTHDFAGLVMIPLAVTLFAGILQLQNAFVRLYIKDRARARSVLVRGLVTTAVCFTVLFFWWRYQQGRTFNTLLDAASRFEQEGDLIGAADYLQRYVIAMPESQDVLVRLAEVYDKATEGTAPRIRAIENYRMAWRSLPERVDLGKRAAEIALTTNEFRTAIQLSTELIDVADGSQHEELQNWAIEARAESLVGYLRSRTARLDYSWDDAVAALELVLDGNLAEPHHYALLATIYRTRVSKMDTDERNAVADQLMERLISDHGENPRAWLAKYRYSRQYLSADWSAAQPADAALERALELVDIENDAFAVEVLMALAVRRQELDQTENAERHLQRAIQAQPTDHRPYVLLADIQRQKKDEDQGRAEAVVTLRDGLERTGNREVSIILPLASLLAESGQIEDAERHLVRLERALPRMRGQDQGMVLLGLHLVRAQMLASQNRLSDAIQELTSAFATREVRLAAPYVPYLGGRTWMYLGQLYDRINSPDRATIAYLQAGRLTESLPGWRESLARTALEAGDLDLAVDQFERLAQVRPREIEYWLSLANARLQRQLRSTRSGKEWQATLVAYEQAKELGENQMAVALLGADLSVAQGQAEQAAQVLQAAVEVNPDEELLWRALAIILQNMGQLEEALPIVDRYTELATSQVDAAAIRAGILARLGRDKAAIDLLESWQTDIPEADRPAAILALARLRLQLGQRKDAKADLEAARSDTSLPARDRIQFEELLAQTAFLERDWEGLAVYEQWLQASEGEHGTQALAYRAQRLLERTGVEAGWAQRLSRREPDLPVDARGP